MDVVPYMLFVVQLFRKNVRKRRKWSECMRTVWFYWISTDCNWPSHLTHIFQPFHIGPPLPIIFNGPLWNWAVCLCWCNRKLITSFNVHFVAPTYILFVYLLFKWVTNTGGCYCCAVTRTHLLMRMKKKNNNENTK